MAIIMPLFATVVVLYGLIKRVPVFDLFIKGVREGVKVLYTIAPTIIVRAEQSMLYVTLSPLPQIF